MRVIQVGIGGMGETWLKTILDSSTVSYAGFVEINEAVIERQVQVYGIDKTRVFGTLQDALAEVKADGVIDVTPPRFHRHVSLTALEAGLPVLSEKPLADSLVDAYAIVRKSNETGILHMVAQNYRYSIPAQTLKCVLQSGEMGAVGAVSVRFYKGKHFGGFREEMEYPLIIDMAIHHFDLARFFLDSSPVSVYGRSWNPPWSWFRGDASAAVSMHFANGVPVTYEGSWCTNGRETTWNGDWCVECEKGVIEMVEDVVRLYRLIEVNGFNNVYSEPEIVDPVALERQGQAYLLQEFYEAVTHGKQPLTNCQDNIHSLATVFNIVQSIEMGQVIQIGE